jgi:hypothetical protein
MSGMRFLIAIAFCKNRGLPDPDKGLANHQLCSLAAFANNCTRPTRSVS